jgi:hypothetical protein
MRASLTATYICASATFARRAADIEAKHPDALDGECLMEHRGLVTAAVMQSVAALEAESWEVTTYGPGHHLGSNGIDGEALAFLKPLADVIDGESVLERYRLILHLLKKAALDAGAQPCQGASLLVRLRNELVHYKSKWGRDMDREKLFKSLQHLKHTAPPFAKNANNFFPAQCLSAACAMWAVKTTAALLDAFYAQLGVSSPLATYAPQLVGLR